MVTVMEVWHLKPEYVTNSTEIMQEMDDLVGPNAHEHPGWCGHASFFQDADNPTRITMIYPWANRELHEDITNREKNLLQGFIAKYCSSDRLIGYFDQLSVDVESSEHH